MCVCVLSGIELSRSIPGITLAWEGGAQGHFCSPGTPQEDKSTPACLNHLQRWEKNGGCALRLLVVRDLTGESPPV